MEEVLWVRKERITNFTSHSVAWNHFRFVWIPSIVTTHLSSLHTHHYRSFTKSKLAVHHEYFGPVSALPKFDDLPVVSELHLPPTTRLVARDEVLGAISDCKVGISFEIARILCTRICLLPLFLRPLIGPYMTVDWYINLDSRFSNGRRASPGQVMTSSRSVLNSDTCNCAPSF